MYWYIHQKPSSVSHLWIKAKEEFILLLHEMSKETEPSPEPLNSISKVSTNLINIILSI